MASGVTMVDVPIVGAPATIIASYRPIAQGRAPPPVGHHHRLGESSSYADACLGLLLCHDTDLCLLIGVGPHLLRMW
jgi:hypothetical protein